MYLSKIPVTAWVSYIQSHFESRGCYIPNDVAERLCEAVEQQSSYVQQLASVLLPMLSTGETATMDHLHAALSSLLDACTPLFRQQISTLTGYQLNCLRALLKGHHSDLGEEHVRKEFNLGSASNIPRLKSALLERDLIEIDGREVCFADPVFARWLSERERF